MISRLLTILASFLLSSTNCLSQDFYKFNKSKEEGCYNNLIILQNNSSYLNTNAVNDTNKIGINYKVNSSSKKDTLSVKIVLNNELNTDDSKTEIYRTLNQAETYLRKNFLTGEMKFDEKFDNPDIIINYINNNNICADTINTNGGYYKEDCNGKPNIYISNTHSKQLNLVLHEFGHYLIHICEYEERISYVNHFNQYDFSCNWDIVDSNILFSSLTTINPRTSVQQIMSSRFNVDNYTQASGCLYSNKMDIASSTKDTLRLVNYYLNCVDCNIEQRKFNKLLKLHADSVKVYKELNESEIEHMNKVYNFQYDKYLIPAIKLNPYLSIGKNDFITQQMEEYRKIRRLKIKAWLDALNLID